MREILSEVGLLIQSFSAGGMEQKIEMVEGEPTVEVLGNVREFSQSKRWFRDTTPRPDIG